MNAVIGGVLQQFSSRHGMLLHSADREFDGTGEVFVTERGQERAHRRLDPLPGRDEACHRREIGGIEGRATLRTTAPGNPSPSRALNM